MGADGINLSAKTDVPAHIGRQEGNQFSLPPLFVLLRPFYPKD